MTNTTQARLGSRQFRILDTLIGRGYTAASISSIRPIGEQDGRNHHASVRSLEARGLVELVEHPTRIGIRITDAGRKAWYKVTGPPKMQWPDPSGTTIEKGWGKPYGIAQPF